MHQRVEAPWKHSTPWDTSQHNLMGNSFFGGKCGSHKLNGTAFRSYHLPSKQTCFWADWNCDFREECNRVCISNYIKPSLRTPANKNSSSDGAISCSWIPLVISPLWVGRLRKGGPLPIVNGAIKVWVIPLARGITLLYKAIYRGRIAPLITIV